jgi:hypothetical protein
MYPPMLTLVTAYYYYYHLTRFQGQGQANRHMYDNRGRSITENRDNHPIPIRKAPCQLQDRYWLPKDFPPGIVVCSVKDQRPNKSFVHRLLLKQWCKFDNIQTI